MDWRQTRVRMVAIIRMCEEYDERFKELMKSRREDDTFGYTESRARLKAISKLLDEEIESVVTNDRA